MPVFVVEYTYSPETSSGRDDHRTDHRAWLAELVRRKVVLSSGPRADHTGAQFIVDGADEDTVTRLFTHDPFARANLVSKVLIRIWNPRDWRNPRLGADPRQCRDMPIGHRWRNWPNRARYLLRLDDLWYSTVLVQRSWSPAESLRDQLPRQLLGARVRDDDTNAVRVATIDERHPADRLRVCGRVICA